MCLHFRKKDRVGKWGEILFGCFLRLFQFKIFNIHVSGQHVFTVVLTGRKLIDMYSITLTGSREAPVPMSPIRNRDLIKDTFMTRSLPLSGL